MADSTLELNYSRWLPADHPAPILDLGCGDGRVLRFLADKGFRQVHGVDRDAAALASIGTLPGVTLECTEVGLDYLRAQRGRFRLIIAKQMIYYIDRGEALAYMRALRDALADDGVLLVEYFNGSLLSSRMTELKDPFIRTAYTEHAMRRLFTASGLHEWFTGGERRPANPRLRSRVYDALRAAWMAAYKAILILERGHDSELPRIYTKSIIAVAGRQPAPGH